MAWDYLTDNLEITIGSAGYASGDYCILFTNNGSGAISWATAADGRQIALTGTTISVEYTVSVCGTWDFSVETYDSKGNTEGHAAADNAQMYVDLVPDKPSNMTVSSYDRVNDTLVVNV